MKIKFLATSDMHGYITPFKYSDRSHAQIGLAALAQFIRQENDENCILVDNGDILQGSPLAYYHHLFLEDQTHPMALCLNELKYDYYNIGNHDFNYHQDVLHRFISDIDAKCITGNILDENHRFDYKYEIKELNGVRVVMIGATNDYISNWELASHIENITFKSAFDYVKETVEYVKENETYDLICVVYHGGFEKNLDGTQLALKTEDNCGYRMVSEIEGIDLLISGHQHRSISEKVCNTYVTQTASNAAELAYVVYDSDTKQFSGELIAAKYDADKILMDLISEEEAQTQKWLDQPIGVLQDGDCLIKDEVDARIHKHACVSLLNQIQKDHYQADLSAVALFNDAAGFNQSITMRDIVSTYVYPNTLVKILLTGAQLKKYLETAARYFDVKEDVVVISDNFMVPKPIHYEYDMVDGLEYTIQAHRPEGSRVCEMKICNVLVEDTDLFSIVVNNYRMAGGGNYHILKQGVVLKDDGKEMVEIIAEYIMKNTPVKINHENNIKVIV